MKLVTCTWVRVTAFAALGAVATLGESVAAPASNAETGQTAHPPAAAGEVAKPGEAGLLQELDTLRIQTTLLHERLALVRDASQHSHAIVYLFLAALAGLGLLGAYAYVRKEERNAAARLDRLRRSLAEQFDDMGRRLDAQTETLHATVEHRLAEEKERVQSEAETRYRTTLETVERLTADRSSELRQQLERELAPLHDAQLRGRCDALELESEAALGSNRIATALQLYRRLLTLVARTDLDWRVSYYLENVQAALQAVRESATDTGAGALDGRDARELETALNDLSAEHPKAVQQILAAVAAVRQTESSDR